MASHPGQHSVILELQRATHVTLQLLHEELADLGLTSGEINALANINGGGETISELGAAIGTRPSTLTGVLDRLETRGYIARRPRPGDRRSVSVDLTPEGRSVVTTILTAIALIERSTLHDLPRRDIDGFLSVVHALSEPSP